MSQIINIKTANLHQLGYNSLEDWLKNPNHIYIGRKNNYVKGATHSKWHNPFKLQIQKNASKYVNEKAREDCINKYEEYLTNNEELMGQLKELEGKVLGCWCKPLGCHGDVLVKYVSFLGKK